jgi:hypothetical protein
VPDPVVLPAELPPCLLQYGFSTLPSPLQVSAPAADSPGLINVWVSTPDGPLLYCNKVVLAVPIGGTETDLTEHTPSVTPNTTWWAVSSLVVETGDVLGLDASTTYAVFTAVCPSNAHWLIDYDLQFSLVTSAVNAKQGTFGYVVAENSGTDPSHLELHRSVFGLGKGPVVTYLSDVATTLAPPESTALPVTTFASGQPIRVAWESNADTFAVYVGAGSEPAWTGPDTSTVLTAGLTSDATITVVATGPGATCIGRTTVAISNPTLTPTSVAAGSLAVPGSTTLAATTAANVASGTAHVTGRATLGAPTQAGSLQVTGGASVQGGAVLAAATATGAVTVDGPATLGSAAATTLRVSSGTSWFTPRSIGPGGYVASSDGLVVGTVGYPSDAGKKCAAIAYATTSGVPTVYARGGNIAFWVNSKKWSMWVHPNSFTLPVRRGAGFSVGVMQVQGADVAAPTAFSWIPFGTAATLRELSDEEAAGYGLGAVAPPEPVPWESPRVGHEVAGVVNALAEILGERLTPPLRTRLRDAVLTLAIRRGRS